ncbi:hypothetical protein BMR99_11215 [Propionibacterium freudenreichii]|uniref:MFS transporter n=1 Tax=Propionibacterium freudenreichii TaxID=1744 RepID=A0A509MK51_9ACTN|nr:MFS transporter [Propionibacterium freudenreichii]ARO12951.1 hypothetical protein BMR99_11215 [Propionibacterium freudenreichii]MCT2992049.1 MFS transporter [Propionibacterium freudenreichii]MCT2992585.1 MFS transporter [Propionibacterium freudenreichii]MDK9664166.1 MFS transporter [Propionibacterium freudenreichii]CEH05894.1 Hypothetical membrane protein [Propionibacterium freudenreichii]
MQRTVRRDYLLWLTATTSDMLSRSVWSLALPFVIFGLTRSTATAGVVQSVGQAAYLCVMLLGGALVDRINRRTGMVVRGITGMVLWIGLGLLLYAHALSLWLLVAIFVAAQLCDGLFGMADNAALRSIVRDDEQFVQVTGINQGREAAVRVGGGPIGGLLYAVGAAIPFLVSGALLGLLIASARAIRADLRPPAAPKTSEPRRGIVRSVGQSVAQGVTFLWGHHILRTLAIAALFINAAFSVVISTALLGLLGDGYSALQLSYLEAVYGAVMLVTALVAAKVVGRLPTGRLLMGAQVFIVCVAVGAAGWHSYAMLFVWLSLYGLVTPLFATSLSGYTFARTPDRLQGRVHSAAALLELSATMVIPALAGWMVHAGCATQSYLVGAVLALVGVGVVAADRGARRLGPTRTWRDGEADPGSAHPQRDGASECPPEHDAGSSFLLRGAGQPAHSPTTVARRLPACEGVDPVGELVDVEEGPVHPVVELFIGDAAAHGDRGAKTRGSDDATGRHEPDEGPADPWHGIPVVHHREPARRRLLGHRRAREHRLHDDVVIGVDELHLRALIALMAEPALRRPRERVGHVVASAAFGRTVRFDECPQATGEHGTHGARIVGYAHDQSAFRAHAALVFGDIFTTLVSESTAPRMAAINCPSSSPSAVMMNESALTFHDVPRGTFVI